MCCKWNGGTMRCGILAVVAVLLVTAGCSNTRFVAPAVTGKPTSTPSTPSPVKSCPPTRQVIVWTRVPGAPNSARVLGNYNAATCETTFKWLQDSSPAGPGYCTEAAYARDNPGYDVDASPAPHPKGVRVAVGGAC